VEVKNDFGACQTTGAQLTIAAPWATKLEVSLTQTASWCAGQVPARNASWNKHLV